MSLISTCGCEGVYGVSGRPDADDDINVQGRVADLGPEELGLRLGGVHGVEERLVEEHRPAGGGLERHLQLLMWLWVSAAFWLVLYTHIQQKQTHPARLDGHLRVLLLHPLLQQCHRHVRPRLVVLVLDGARRHHRGHRRRGRRGHRLGAATLRLLLQLQLALAEPGPVLARGRVLPAPQRQALLQRRLGLGVLPQPKGGDPGRLMIVNACI